MGVKGREVCRGAAVDEHRDSVTLNEQDVEVKCQPAVPVRHPEHLRAGHIHLTDLQHPQTVERPHARYPPSTLSSAPVTKDDSSEARNTAADATSPGELGRPSGTRATNAAVRSDVLAPRPSVSTTEGVSVFTRTPRRAYVTAAFRVRIATPAFAAWYAGASGWPRKPEIDPTLMIDPDRLSTIGGMNARMLKKTLERFRSSVRFQVSVECSWSGDESIRPPALLTTMCGGSPASSRASSVHVRSSVTSRWCMDASSRSPTGRRMSTPITLAPSWTKASAMARPIPCATPETRATFPKSRAPGEAGSTSGHTGDVHFGLEETTRIEDLPEGHVGVLDDRRFDARLHKLALAHVGMRRDAVHDRLRHADLERKMRAIHRMAKRREPCPAPLAPPALPAGELVCLAHVMDERRRDQQVVVDLDRAHDRLESPGHPDRHGRHTPIVIRLRPTSHQRALRDAGRRNVLDPSIRGLGKCDRVELDDLLAQRQVADHLDLRERLLDAFPELLGHVPFDVDHHRLLSSAIE